MKKIKDILFPTNLLGKNKKSVAFDPGDTPIIDDEQTFVIEWQGERLQMNYTIHVYRPAYPHYIDRYDQHKVNYSGGGTETITLPHDATPPRVNTLHGEIFFNCTNVTSLVVNGEQLI